ncbi:MAG: ATP-binding protein [Leptospiraceae bacterium]|nr:ATP-binding protein [Leptospiraceae bacterium]
MKPRLLSEKVLQVYRKYPILTITGPRQSGKTTLSRMLFPQKKYVTLENPDNREFAQVDPLGFLKEYENGAIIDEIQRCPDLASYLQGEVDKNNSPGRFILTGSGQFELMQSVSQSLAGRTAILRLLPFSLEETDSFVERRDSNEVLFTGFYPRIFDQNLDPQDYYSFYIDTYLQRDVRMILNIQDLSRFEIFLKLCAGRTGQILNYNELGTASGVSHNTIKSWINVLEASFIIKLIRPYYKNLNLRLIKSPKLFFLDTGLVCSLLGIKNSEHIKNHPLKGAIFETFIVSEIIKNRFNKGLKEDLYFLRDSKGHEIDLVFDSGMTCDLCEIKSSMTINKDFFKNIQYFSKMELPIKNKYIIYGGEEKRNQLKVEILPWDRIREIEY